MRMFLRFLKTHTALALICLFSIVLFLIICYPAGLYFLCDDFAHIPKTIDGDLFHTHLLRPLLYTTLWLDIKLWGMQAAGFHITNLIIHVANSSLVFFFSRHILKKYLDGINSPNRLALFTALLFLCYGFHSEPLFWIDGRDGAFVTLFMQASFFCYFKEKKAYLIPALLFFIAALFTYELSWTLPLLVTSFFLYDRYYKKIKKTFLPVMLFWLVFAGYLLFRYGLSKNSVGVYEAGNALHGNYFSLLYNFTALAGRTFLPPLKSGYLFLALYAAAVCLMLALLFFILRKRSATFALLLLLFCCLGISVLPVVSLGIDTHDTESERFIYPASVFACMILVVLTAELAKNKKQVSGVLVLVICLHLYYLYRASVAYRYASYVSRFTIESLNTAPGIKKVTFDNLPTQYQGALLFRIGFAKWAPGILNTVYDSIEIRSFREVTEMKKMIRVTDTSEIKSDHLYVRFTSDTLKMRY